MSNQSTLQAAIRVETGTTGTLNEDWLALFTAAGFSTGSFNERMLSWLNNGLGTTYTSLPAAQAAFATAEGVASWSAVSTISSAAPNGALVLNGDYLQLDGSYLVIT